MHLGPFGCHTNHGTKRAELVQKFENEIASEFFAPNAPDPPHWTLNFCFGAFCTIWVHSGPFGCLTKLGAKRPNLCKCSCHEVSLEFFATNTPDPPHWTLSRHFGAFHTIWVHSGPFGCLTKLDAKRAELVQKFVPRSRVGIFRNERNRSTALGPKLTFWCVFF